MASKNARQSKGGKKEADCNVLVCYIDNLSLRAIPKFPASALLEQTFEDMKSAIFPLIQAHIPSIRKEDLAVSCSVRGEPPSNITSVADFVERGGHVFISPNGNSFVEQILLLNETIDKLRLQLSMQAQVQQASNSQDATSSSSSSAVSASPTPTISSKPPEVKQDEMLITKQNLEMLQSHLKCSNSIICRQLLLDQFANLSAGDQAVTLRYKNDALNSQAHPCFTDDDDYVVEHAIWDIDASPAQRKALHAAFESRFHRKVRGKSSQFAHTSGQDPTVKADRAISAMIGFLQKTHNLHKQEREEDELERKAEAEERKAEAQERQRKEEEERQRKEEERQRKEEERQRKEEERQRKEEERQRKEEERETERRKKEAEREKRYEEEFQALVETIQSVLGASIGELSSGK